MREPSIYMSDIFLSTIWPGFCERMDYSERTKQEYFYVLVFACDFLERDFVKIDEEAARKLYDHFIQKMNTGKFSRNTVSFKIHSLMTVANYVQYEMADMIPGYNNPFVKLPTVPVSTAIPKNTLPSMEELDKIMSNCSQQLYFIMSLSLKCGLSTSEVLKLRREQFCNIDGNNYIYVPAANLKKESRYVKIPEDVFNLYLEYLASEPKTDVDGHLFLNRHGNVMGLKNVEYEIKKTERAAGIGVDFTLKDLRNRAVLSMLKASNNPNGVASQVGIRRLRMESYVRSVGMFADGKAPSDLLNFQIKPFFKDTEKMQTQM